MFFTRLTYILLLLCAAVCCRAQDSLLLRDYSFVKQSNPWLTSSNAAGLTTYKSTNIAEAELGLAYESGGLIDYWQAPKVFQVNASAEAIQRLSSRTVVFGRVSYENFSGRDMAGSAFINPTRKPFDIVEETTENTGTKHQDTYQLTGAIGVDLWKGISLGGRVDYTAANYAKYKDLRHSNKLMDLRLSIGLMARVLNQLHLGVNYQYHRNTESITFSKYGKEDKVYKSLIAYAAFMGRLEQLGTSGYTEMGREMPLVEDQHGGSLQIVWKPSSQWSFHNEFSLAHGTGYYGRKSPYTITFTNHERDLLAYQGTLQYAQASTIHRLDAQLRTEKLINNNETYRELTNSTGAYYYEYYDPVKSADKKWTNLGLCYTAYLKVRQEMPTWMLSAGVDWMQRKVTGILYPYYRTQKLKTTFIHASATRNFLLHQGVLSTTMNVGYQKGSGSPYQDGIYQMPSNNQQTPPTTDCWLYQEYRYLTAAQYHVGAEVKYSFLFPETHLNTFARGGFNYRTTSTSNEYTDGNYRLSLQLAIGCLF